MPLPATGREVGVDVGVARFLTTSDGEVVDNPRFLAASAEVIADLERRKARARPGSGTASGSAARWQRSGARSVTGAVTSTIRPRGRWSSGAT